MARLIRRGSRPRPTSASDDSSARARASAAATPPSAEWFELCSDRADDGMLYARGGGLGGAPPYELQPSLRAFEAALQSLLGLGGSTSAAGAAERSPTRATPSRRAFSPCGQGRRSAGKCATPAPTDP